MQSSGLGCSRSTGASGGFSLEFPWGIYSNYFGISSGQSLAKLQCNLFSRAFLIAPPLASRTSMRLSSRTAEAARGRAGVSVDVQCVYQ